MLKNTDPRGKFVEVFKSSTFGQVSYLTISANQERGGHYHHTKTEKFLVLKGSVIFRFQNLITKEFVELKVTSDDSRVVDTIPGWAHDIINISSEEAIIMIWCNEIYDPKNPDTIQHKSFNMKKLKVITIVGTRPELIRLSRIISKLDKFCEHILVHTGQNYDHELNQIFLMILK